MTRTLAAVALAATYLAALGHAAPADVALALLLGAGASRLAVRTRGPGAAELARRAAAFPGFALAAAGSILAGAWTVLGVVVGRRGARRMGIVEVPLDGRSELGITVSGLVAILSPGSLLVDIDRERGVLVFHVIDASDPDAARARLRRFYTRHQRRVFP